jgi:hypothetical protein
VIEHVRDEETNDLIGYFGEDPGDPVGDGRRGRPRVSGDDRGVRGRTGGNLRRDRYRSGPPLGPDASFIIGSDLLIDGGVIAGLRSGRLQLPG